MVERRGLVAAGGSMSVLDGEEKAMAGAKKEGCRWVAAALGEEDLICN